MNNSKKKDMENNDYKCFDELEDELKFGEKDDEVDLTALGIDLDGEGQDADGAGMGMKGVLEGRGLPNFMDMYAQIQEGMDEAGVSAVCSGASELMRLGNKARENMGTDALKKYTMEFFYIYRDTRDDPGLADLASYAYTMIVYLNEGYIKKLIHKRYKTYVHKHFEELYMAGILGLMTAIEKFDPDKGYAFTTLADPWIKGEITKEVNEINSVSTHYGMQIAKVNRAKSMLAKNGIIDPTPAQLRDASGLSIEAVYLALDLQKAQLTQMYGDEKTLNAIMEGSSGQYSKSPEQVYETTEKTNALYGALDTLDPRENQVIRYRFGLDPDPSPKARPQAEMDFKRIGQLMDMPVDEVKETYRRAIRNLERNKTLREQFSYSKDYKVAKTLHDCDMSVSIQADDLMDGIEVRILNNQTSKSVTIQML